MPEFRDQILYFIVVDRFFDGDTQNNQGKDSQSYDVTRTKWYMYWGGDLLGIAKKLSYLRNMGISALWITPVFDQVDGVVQMAVPMAPYHGYWAKDFRRLDEHLVEDPADVRLFTRQNTVFDELLSDMHASGMKLILDVVCNHSNPTTPGARGELYDDGRKLASYDEDRGHWYHHAGEVVDWTNLDEVQSKSFAGLADFNETSFAFRSYIKACIKAWIDKGCDGLRVDTVKHMPLWFWQEFSCDMLKHKPDLFMFGEWFLGGVYDAAAVEFANKSGMSMLDFALCFAIQNALGKDRSMREIEEVVQHDAAYRSATELVTFVDNHDLPRFLSLRNDSQRLRMAVNLILCARGIPCIYYGTEQGLHDDTNQGRDPYNRPMMQSWDETAIIYRDIAKLAKLRKENLAVQKGSMLTRALSDDVYVFERVYMGHSCLVALNKGPAQPVALCQVALLDGQYENILGGQLLHVQAGRAALTLEADSVHVYACTLPEITGQAVVNFQVNGHRAQADEQMFICGDCFELGNWDIAKAVALEFINGNTWAIDIPIRESAGQTIRYKYFTKTCKGHIVRENSLGHSHTMPERGKAICRDDWQ